MKMKLLLGCLMAVGCWAIAGCSGGSGPTNTVEDASQSDIDEYNRMLQESQSQMKQSEDAAKKEGIKGY